MTTTSQRSRRHPSSLPLLTALWSGLYLLLLTGNNHGAVLAQTTDVPIMWASTGGGWRAMFADIGYANVFQQAGLLTEDSSRFTGVSTTSGGSWFSTQLFYSQEFYDRSVMAESPLAVNEFVLEWMATYLNISTNIDEATIQQCNASNLETQENYDVYEEYITNLVDVCQLLVKYDFDWTKFIQAMLEAASVGYGTPDFIATKALPENRIEVLRDTTLLIQATLVPNSRIRSTTSATADSTAVYLGHNPAESTTTKLFAVPISAAYVIETGKSGFEYGIEDITSNLQTYLAPTPAAQSWSDWDMFALYDGAGPDGTTGTIQINNTQVEGGSTQVGGDFRVPFGGYENTTVIQIASVSSAAGGSGSPLVPSIYTQMFSIGRYDINQQKVRTLWRVLAGCAAGLGVGFLVAGAMMYFGSPTCFREQATANKAGGFTGICAGIAIGLLTGILYGLGSILVPTIYDGGVDRIYQNNSFDNFAVCTQWPNTCGEEDGFMIDGWFVDNPALVINVAYNQRKILEADGNATLAGTPMKAIVTNTNDLWNTTFNRAQLLAYYSTYFNEGVAPGDFVWAPKYYAPFRSPQIFSEYLDEAGLDALLEPIAGSNGTTALLSGTTVDNPSFGVVAGQKVEILLLNTNANITTFVIGASAIEDLTIPLADMTSNIAASEELVQRVRDFADGL